MTIPDWPCRAVRNLVAAVSGRTDRLVVDLAGGAGGVIEPTMGLACRYRGVGGAKLGEEVGSRLAGGEINHGRGLLDGASSGGGEAEDGKRGRRTG